LPIGSTLTQSDFSWEMWPRASSSPGMVLRSERPDAMADLSGAIARSPFFSGEPIRGAKLAQPGSGFMSAILPKGKRAVATAISADTSAGGFILPNDQVDVIMTRRVDAPTSGGQEQFITETILRNVRVLAIDQTIEEKNGEPVVVGQTATLELTPRQAEILTAAQQMSERLTLALRSLADSVATDADLQDAGHLIGSVRNGGGVTIVRNGVPIEVPAAR
jgi:pilus assembly protein CpaB